MLHLEKILNARDISFNHLDNCIMYVPHCHPFDLYNLVIRCFPHIINICCQHILAEFTDLALSDPAAEFFATNPHTAAHAQLFEEAIERDPISLGRAIVRTICASGQRREHFAAIIKEGNAHGHFSIGELDGVQVPLVQLLRDVQTRWDSVYYMIRRLRQLRPVFNWIHYLTIH